MTTNPRPRRAMRVAVPILGAAAGVAAFAPAAQAAVRPGPPVQEHAGGQGAGPASVRLGTGGMRVYGADTEAPGQPYTLGVKISSYVEAFHVCGWHPTNTWRCTAEIKNPLFRLAAGSWYDSNVGGNYRSWDRGQVDVYWNAGGPGSWDTCNTNGAYSGYLASEYNVVLTGNKKGIIIGGGPGTGPGIGTGASKC
jgi:hypothetical protein